MKKIIVFCFFLTIFNSVSFASEREDIHRIITELDFLIDSTEQLQAVHKHSKEDIRFNYEALLKQLNTTRSRVAQYLNNEAQAYQLTPPKPVDSPLARSR